MKACTSCATFSLTDTIAQQRERRDASCQAQPYDAVRTARCGLFGLLYLGPLNHVFWGRSRFGLEYWFPGPTWRAVFSRVFVDQITVMPLNMVMFLSWPGLLRGDLTAAARDVRTSFWESFTFALSIWPFVHRMLAAANHRASRGMTPRSAASEEPSCVRLARSAELSLRPARTPAACPQRLLSWRLLIRHVGQRARCGHCRCCTHDRDGGQARCSRQHARFNTSTLSQTRHQARSRRSRLLMCQSQQGCRSQAIHNNIKT